MCMLYVAYIGMCGTVCVIGRGMISTSSSSSSSLTENSDDDLEFEDESWPLVEKMKELSTARDLVWLKHQELNRVLSEVATMGLGSGATLAKLTEPVTMFKITADAMAKVSGLRVDREGCGR